MTIRMTIWGSHMEQPLQELADHYTKTVNPQVRIQVETQLWSAYDMWFHIQIVSGDPPEIMQAQWYWSWDYGRKGQLEAFDPYLEEVNPYTGEVWGEQFFQGRLDSSRAPDRRLYIIPHDQVKTAVFYNVDMFKRLGLEPPRDWEEFEEVCRRLKEAGVTPIGIPNAVRYESECINWAVSSFFDNVYRHKIPQLDVIVPDGIVDKEESLRGYYLGIIEPHQPEYQAIWKLFADWSRWWNPDFNGSRSADINRAFEDQRVAMAIYGVWWVKTLSEELAQLPPERRFEFGVFPLPNVTKETSPYFEPPLGSVGSVGMGYVIPANLDEKRLRAALDWLRYLITPENIVREWTICPNDGEWIDLTVLDPALARPVAVEEPVCPACGTRFHRVGKDHVYPERLRVRGRWVELFEGGRLRDGGDLKREGVSLERLAERATVRGVGRELNLPCVKGVPIGEEYKGFLPLMDGTYPDLRILEGAIFPDEQAGDQWFTLMQEYLAGALTLEEFTDALAEVVREGTQRAIIEYNYDPSTWPGVSGG